MFALTRNRWLTSRPVTTLAATAVVAVLVSGCAGRPAGPDAPALASPTSGITAVDAVQEAIGGNWNRPLTSVGSPCRLGDEEGLGDGVQELASTESQAPRTETDALAAVDLAAQALHESGTPPGDVIQADGIAAVTGVGADASSVTVTIDTTRAAIEFRGPCLPG